MARCDSIFPLLRCQGLCNKTYTQLSIFPNPFSESEDWQSWGCSKILLSFLMRFEGHFWPNQQQQQCLPQFKPVLDGHLSSSSTSSLPSQNREYHLKSLIGSEPHSHKSFAPILVFLSRIDQLWNKFLWQLSVYFRHPWCIKKTDFTIQVITRILSKINKRNSVCKRMLVDST